MKLLLLIISLTLCFSFSFGQSNFNNNKPFTILSSKREITKQSSATDTVTCKGWTISHKNLSNIIHNSKRINGTEWDLTFEVLPCIITGKLRQNKQIFKFEINAGSWIYIISKKTTIILGDYKKSDEKFFIIRPNK